MRVMIPTAENNTERGGQTMAAGRNPARGYVARFIGVGHGAIKEEVTMMLLTSTAPRVVPGRAIDILDVAPDRGMSRGFARVDLGDPVFFDHPLDHVPGMLLTVAILELAEHDSMLESDNVTFRLTFTRFCELNAPVQVTATREASGTNRIQVTQSGRNIATGLLGRRETQPLIGACPGARAWGWTRSPVNWCIGPTTATSRWVP